MMFVLDSSKYWIVIRPKTNYFYPHKSYYITRLVITCIRKEHVSRKVINIKNSMFVLDSLKCWIVIRAKANYFYPHKSYYITRLTITCIRIEHVSRKVINLNNTMFVLDSSKYWIVIRPKANYFYPHKSCYITRLAITCIRKEHVSRESY